MSVTKTLSSATSTRPLLAKSSRMTGLTRWNLQISSSVGMRPVFLSGRGAISVVRSAYLVPSGRLTSFRNRRMPRIGLPMRPGELKTYRSAGGGRFASTSRM